MRGPQRPSLRLLSLNVNGLSSSPSKRQQLFTQLLQQQWDVILLQETHCPNDVEAARWCREGASPAHPWAGAAFWSHGSSSSRGVAILLRSGGSIDIDSASLRHCSTDGRLLLVDIQAHGQPLTFACVYAPCTAADRPAFFQQQLHEALPHHRNLLVGGDFNCILNPLDVAGCTVGNRSRGAAELQQQQHTYELVDIWRQQHGDQTDVTFVHQQGSARLDRWLITSQLSHTVTACAIVSGFATDHLGVSIDMVPPAAPYTGPGLWRLPTHLLNDEELVQATRREMLAWQQQHPAGAGTDHALRWVQLKQYIAGFLQQQGSRRRKQHQQQERLQQQQLAAAKAAYLADPTDVAKLQHWKGAHQLLLQEVARECKLWAARAGVAWHLYGEQSTYYFYHTAKKRQQATCISSITPSAAVPDASAPLELSTWAGSRQAEPAFRLHFSAETPQGLFAAPVTDSAAQQELLAAVDVTLTAAEADACEGPPEGVTAAELAAALKQMQRNKAPGADGLPYEFYVTFWEDVAPMLELALQAAFATGQLPELMQQGVITLIHKGKGLDRSHLSSYRPITLLNADIKLLGKVLANRWGPQCGSIIGPTQTGFLPNRWIGDNVLSHLEEVDYMAESGQVGVSCHLDWKSAFDAVDRQWTLMVMRSFGFPQQAVRWASLLLQNTTCRVMYNGCLTDAFPTASGNPQGGPLSPLLYILGVEPLARHCQQQALTGRITPLRMPDGQPAPVVHLHCDDTSLHVSSSRDVRTLLDGSLRLHQRASGASLQPAKSAELQYGTTSADSTRDSLTGIIVVGRQQSLRHLGIRLGLDRRACDEATFKPILGKMQAESSRWSSRDLSLLGRVHVAKQVLASQLWYHATFLRPSRAEEQWATRILAHFTKGSQARQLQAYLPTTAAARDEPPDLPSPSPPRQQPPPAPSHSFPSRQVCALPIQHGGLAMAEVPTQISALQGKHISRLLEPEHLPWKTLATRWFTSAPLAAPAGSSAAAQQAPHVACLLHQLGYGAAILFSSMDLLHLPLSTRVLGYLRAFRQTQPHRIVDPAQMTSSQVLNEGIFFNRQIVNASGDPLHPETPIWQQWLQQSCTKLIHLQQRLQQQQPELPGTELVLTSMPQHWSDIVTQQHAQPPLEDTWHVSATDSGAVYWQPAGGGPSIRHALLPSARLRPIGPCDLPPADQLRPAFVMHWDSTRPWRQRAPQPGSAACPYYRGILYSSAHVDPTLWGWGQQPAHQWVVRDMAARIRILNFRQAKPEQQQPTLRPRLLVDPLATPGTTGLAFEEGKWLRALACGQRPHASQEEDSAATTDATWMHPSPPRLHPLQRRQRRQDLAQQQPLPATQPRQHLLRDDRQDAMAPTAGDPYWKPYWSFMADGDFDRHHRVTSFRLLHCALACGAFKAYTNQQLAPHLALCPFQDCQQQPQTLSHLFLHCPAAAPVCDWLCSQGSAIAAVPCPRTVPVLLAGDRNWFPQGSVALWQCWERLRLAAVHVVWTVVTAATAAGRDDAHPIIAAAIGQAALAKLLATIKAAIRRDWMMVTMDIRRTSGMYAEWFKGRPPTLELAEFQRRWCSGGRLCRVVGDPETPRLELRI